jgi:hypothetical protein
VQTEVSKAIEVPLYEQVCPKLSAQFKAHVQRRWLLDGNRLPRCLSSRLIDARHYDYCILIGHFG